MNWENRITIDPQVCHGKSCIRSTRIMVSIILDYPSAGESVESIQQEYPTLQAEDIQAVLAYAA